MDTTFSHETAVRKDGAMLYSDDLIKVSRRLVRVAGTTYAVAHLTSVKFAQTYVPGLNLRLIGVLTGALVGLIIGILIANGVSNPNALLFIVPTLICATLGYLLSPVRKAIVLYKVEFRLSSGESSVVSTGRNKSHAEEIRNALLRAMNGVNAGEAV